MRNLTVWTTSEITKFFGMINEPFFIEKLCRFTGRSRNEVISQLINFGLCELNSKEKSVSASKYTNLLYVTSHASFIPKLLELGWIYDLSHREESLRAPEWWINSEQFPIKHVDEIERTNTVWVNAEVRSVLGMMKDNINLDEISVKIARNQQAIRKMLVDMGIVDDCTDKITFLPEVNERKLAKYSFNNALVLIDYGWNISEHSLISPYWWIEKNNTASNINNTVINRKKLTTDENRNLYNFIKSDIDKIILHLRSNICFESINILEHGGFKLMDLIEYIGIASCRSDIVVKNDKIPMSFFMNKPYNTKKELIKSGWYVNGDYLISPEWWINENQ
uniref:hypothetical protein n=1 Tax=Photorhabdus sp. RM322S TaxID=3342825 RepID=UPI0036D8ED6C